MGKYGEALGIWHLEVGGADLDLKPVKGDNRKFRRILMNETYKKDKAGMMEAFEDFMIEIIKRDNPNDDPNDIAQYVEFNSQSLFEEVMVKFRWTTREELNKSKQETLKDLKKLTDEN